MKRAISRGALLAGLCALVVGLANCGGGGGSSNPGRSDLASLGIDPLGRGDGIDITQSSYTGRCYEDDTLEANRPMPPDPRDVAAEAAGAAAQASRAAADTAREAFELARQEFEDSFRNPDPQVATLDAGAAYVAAAALALVTADAAYNTAQILFLGLAGEEEPTWTDLFADFELSKLLLIEFKPELDLGGDSFDDLGGAVLDFVSEALTEEQKARVLNFLEQTRDAALEAFELAVAFCPSCSSDPHALVDVDDVPREAIADPLKEQAFDAARAVLDAAEAQSVADSEAAYDARIFAETAPSEFPPCDSEELRQALYESFCTGDFVNPIPPEDEAANPGITERLNAYVERVCEAVSPG